MAVQLLFPTLVYQARLPGWRRLNAPLLRERHGTRRRAWAAPASAVDDQRDLLRRGAAGSAGIEIRGSAARALHGLAAARRRGGARAAAVGDAAGARGRAGAVRELAAP